MNLLAGDVLRQRAEAAWRLRGVLTNQLHRLRKDADRAVIPPHPQRVPEVLWRQ